MAQPFSAPVRGVGQNCETSSEEFAGVWTKVRMPAAELQYRSRPPCGLSSALRQRLRRLLVFSQTSPTPAYQRGLATGGRRPATEIDAWGAASGATLSSSPKEVTPR